jgi:hypothetical protein
MADTIQATQENHIMNWTDYRSYVFRVFKREFSDLSRLHWYYFYAARRVVWDIEQLRSHGHKWAASSFIPAVLPVNDYDAQSLSISPEDFERSEDAAISHLRLVLLVKGCAVAESYLQKYAQYWARWKGYEGEKFNLINRTGRAIIGPSQVSNISNIIPYLEELMGADFGKKKGALGPAYQLRCVAAHNGGIVDHENAKKLQFTKTEIGQQIRLTWNDLKKYLDAIFDVCSQVELVVPSKPRYYIEVNWILQDIFDRDNSTSAIDAKNLLRMYGFTKLPSTQEIRRQFK